MPLIATALHESGAINVFPGNSDAPAIVCDPHARRGRVEETPVSIFRLKRVAADFRTTSKAACLGRHDNGKRIASSRRPRPPSPWPATSRRSLHCTVFDAARAGRHDAHPDSRSPLRIRDLRGDRLHPHLGIEFKGGHRIDADNLALGEL